MWDTLRHTIWLCSREFVQKRQERQFFPKNSRGPPVGKKLGKEKSLWYNKKDRNKQAVSAAKRAI